ncbi:MAG: hypothetical protein KatS3mg038_1642 [Candidatus Kapaibacterium sp.]|nr:MAG: hypothetical protein KatS3mg038_1642 [Candidatus Kapabacteria bacterium]
MPDVLTVLRDRLRTQPEVAALVGDSIYTHEVPHGVELPAIVMELRQATREATLAGYSGYEECDVGVTAIARSRETARAVLAAISDCARRICGLSRRSLRLCGHGSNRRVIFSRARQMQAK